MLYISFIFIFTCLFYLELYILFIDIYMTISFHLYIFLLYLYSYLLIIQPVDAVRSKLSTLTEDLHWSTAVRYLYFTWVFLSHSILLLLYIYCTWQFLFLLTVNVSAGVSVTCVIRWIVVIDNNDDSSVWVPRGSSPSAPWDMNRVSHQRKRSPDCVTEGSPSPSSSSSSSSSGGFWDKNVTFVQSCSAERLQCDCPICVLWICAHSCSTDTGCLSVCLSVSLSLSLSVDQGAGCSGASQQLWGGLEPETCSCLCRSLCPPRVLDWNMLLWFHSWVFDPAVAAGK